MNSILSIQGISKSYGRLQALNNVSIEVPEGTVFGILGPNGSGKTTLLSILLDVLKPNKGNFRWFGEENSSAQRKKIGSLLETPNFYHYMSGLGNLQVTQSISGRGDKADIDRVLQRVRLYERRKSKFRTYSLGMKQRLAVAASLLGSPKVLVLDEPTNGLDPVGIAEMRELIIELRQAGYTIVLASHLLDEVEKVCTHVAILNKGVLVSSGEVSQVLMDEDMVEIGASDITLLESIFNEKNIRVSREDGSRHLFLHYPRGEARLEEINRYCFEKGVVLDHLTLKKKKLEARFFELTNN